MTGGAVQHSHQLAPARGWQVSWLGHASVTLDLDGVRVVTDPLLRRHAGFLRRPGVQPEQRHIAGTDLVLLSHLHLDHADVGSLKLLHRAIVLCPPDAVRWVEHLGLRAQAVTEDFVEVEGVEVAAVDAEHHSRPLPHRPNGATGFLVRRAGRSVYFAGDTSIVPAMSRLAERAGAQVDLALIPIAGWGPRLSAGHLGPLEAAQATAMVDPVAVLPIHFGTFHPPAFNLASRAWMQRPYPLFREHLAELSPATTLLHPGLGRSHTF